MSPGAGRTHHDQGASRVRQHHRVRRRQRAIGRGADHGGRAVRRRPLHRRRAGQRRASRPGPPAGRRRCRRAGGHRLGRRAGRPSALVRPRAGPGRPAAAPRRQARHRPADPRRVLLRLRRRHAVPPRRPQGARAGHAEDRQRGPAVRAPRGHPTRTPCASWPAEPYKCELVGLKGGASEAAEGAGGRSRRRAAEHLRQRPTRRHPRVGRPVPRPAPARHQAHRQRLQGHALGRRVLARRPAQPPAAAHLRHRLAHQSRPHGIPRPARRGRAARPPQAGHRAGPLLLPRRAGLRAGRLPPQGRDHPARDGGLRPAPAHRGGVRLRQHAAHLQGGAVPSPPGTLPYYADEHVPAHGAGGQRATTSSR